MSLSRDISRCLGEGATGVVCRKRKDCQRYIDKGQPGDRLVFAMALCRDDRLEGWIPVKVKDGEK